MLTLTQNSCSIPVTLACCSFEQAVSPVLDPATIAANTVAVITNLTATAPPAAPVEGDAFIVQNRTTALVAMPPLPSLKPGEIASYVWRSNTWTRS